jgi:anti-sigma factor RsiW
MNKLPPQHPESGELLLYLDGELPEARRTSVRKHLEVCWKCRHEAEELAGAVSEYMRYQTAMDSAEPPAGTHPSAGLLREMQLLDAASGQPGLWNRVRLRFGLPGFGYAWRTVAGIGALVTAWAAAGLVRQIVLAPETHTPARQVMPAARPAIPSPAAPMPSVVPPRLSKRVPAAASVPVPVPGPAPEIAALVKLHELGADLGEPVETVAASDGAVAVICRQVGRGRETEIRAALAGIPKVTVQSEAASPADPGRRLRTTLALHNGGGVLEHALAAQVGGKALFDRLANEILDDDDGLMTRAHALHDIEERFPPSRRAALRPDDAVALGAVIADHQRVAIEKGRAIEARVAPIARSLGFVSPPAPPAASGVFAAAERVDRILNVCFGGSPSQLSLSELGSELNSALAELRGALETMR